MLPDPLGDAVGADHKGGRRAGSLTPWLGLATSLAAAFMQLLDATIVNVALPSIAVDLQAGVSAQLLMVSVYILAFACSLITAARLGDLFGRRVVFLTALSVFVVASLLCGLAQSATMLTKKRKSICAGAYTIPSARRAKASSGRRPRYCRDPPWRDRKSVV